MNKQAKISIMSGFTLLEVILALALITIVMTIAYRGVTQLGQARQVINQEQQMQKIARSILNRMIREIRNASKVAEFPGPNVFGYLLGKDQAGSYGYNNDEITFIAQGSGQPLADGIMNTGTVQIKYSLIKDPDNPQSNDEFSNQLIREEIPVKQPYEEALEEKIVFPLYEKVAGIDFKYFSTQEEKWQESWDSQNNLPQLVQIILTLVSNDSKLYNYSVTVGIK